MLPERIPAKRFLPIIGSCITSFGGHPCPFTSVGMVNMGMNWSGENLKKPDPLGVTNHVHHSARRRDRRHLKIVAVFSIIVWLLLLISVLLGYISVPQSIQLETDDGLYLPEADLWLDPHRKRSCAFVSHGHADHFARHDRILTSTPNAHILKVRYNLAESRLVPIDFQQPFEHNGFTIVLFPAGHIYGSAMIHLTRQSDGATLLYTGDFKVRRGITAEEAVFRQADTLIMETTFGKRNYVFPNTTEVSGAILNFVNEALDDGATPVLHAYSLGKAQEALAILTGAGIPAVLSSTTAKMTRACRDAGAGLPEPIRFEGTVPTGSCLICPPNSLRKPDYRGVTNPRTAMLTGWSLTPGARFRFRTDAVFALSDHADFPGLVEAVNRVQPKQVLTVHGYTREFASELRRLNYEAWSVDGEDQLELPLRF